MNKPTFDLGAMLSAPAVQSAVQQIPCDKLHPYHNHKFELYTGERLDDMVASVQENGVLSPIIVQPDGDEYEILIGHNRWNASKIAGLSAVPAIVKTGLSEDEAEMYVIESNVMQRGFDNLRISEQAAVIALRHSEMFSPGKRSDIQRELALLENPDAEVSDTATLNPDLQ
ncbi:MAG: ParB N-terminal domain-containing protein [Ruminococcus sp.]|nr:ParB N-terminal domain-containing protein [Ruminococcus sp.]